MSVTWQTVRVFISSTFRDMQAERDHLVRFVFPRLRQELLQRRIHLVDVDLRWGVTSEQDALSVCREVVDECRPRFLCMLGGRYGWVPPGSTHSITADEVHYGVLDRELTSRGVACFYFRDPSASAAMVETTPGECREVAGSHGAGALAELKTAIVDAGLQPFTYHAQWDDRSRRLIGLKQFGDRVYEDLKRSIDQEFGPSSGQPPNEFAEEHAAMESFIEERVQRFVLGSRQVVWNALQQHAESTGGNGYLCLTGDAGSGKSALMGTFCRDYRDAHPSELVIPHFVGASPGSTDVRRTLRRLCHELAAGAGLTAEIPADLEKLRVAFVALLQQASAQKRVVILIDALNQFDPTTQLARSSWLPEDLPATARIILSTLSGPAPAGAPSHRQPIRRIELQPLDHQDREAIIEAFLHRYRKSMTSTQRAALLAKADAGTPLYLLVALEELRTLGTYEEITARIAELPPDTQALFRWILKRLEDDDGFRDGAGGKIGPELVSQFAALVGTSRHGLSQRELTALLSPDDPHGNVAALTQLLRPYLMQRGELLDFYHGQFRQAAATGYLPSDAQQLAAHDRLATYFQHNADPAHNRHWNGEAPRDFLEVVFHLAGAGRLDDMCQTLCDLRFVESRCRQKHVFELIADYRLAQECLPEAQDDVREDRARDERVRRWTAEMVEYAAQWSGRRERQARGETATEPEPRLPEPVPTGEMWSEDKIEAERERVIAAPTRRDRVEAFAGFVRGQSYPLLLHGAQPGFVAQHAFNTEPAGTVHRAAASIIPTLHDLHVLRRWPAGSTHRPKPALIRTLEGHRGAVGCVSVTPDGRLAVTGSFDKSVRVWDLESGECLRTLEGHTDAVGDVRVTPDGRRVVSGSSDKTARLWDLESGECLRVLGGYSGLGVTPDGRRAVTVSSESSIRVWDLESGTCLRTIDRFSGNPITYVEITPDGRRAVSGGYYDRTVRVWDLESGARLHALEHQRCLGLSQGASPGDLCVVTRGDDHVVRWWHLESGQCLSTGGVISADCDYARVTLDGRRALIVGREPIVRVWDLESGECLRALEGHNNSVWGVSVTPDGRRAVTASHDKTVRVWDLERGDGRRPVTGHREVVDAVSITPDGRHAVTGGDDKAVRVWALESGECLRTFEGQNAWAHCLSLTPDGRHAVTGSGAEDNEIRVWDLERGECLRSFAGHRDTINSVVVTPDGRRVVTGSSDKTVRLWDLKSGDCLRTFEGHQHIVTSATVTPDGRRAVSASSDNTARVWDLESGACLRNLEGHTDSVLSACAMPDGRRVMTGSCDQTVRVWDLESGACLRIFEGHSDAVMSVTLTSDGRRAVTGSWDTTARVWDVESGTCLLVLRGHTDLVYCVSVTPDGRRAVTGSHDETIRVWDLESGECLRTFTGHEYSVWSARVTPDGQCVVSAADDRTIQVWKLDSGACLRRIESHNEPIFGLSVTPDGRHVVTGNGDKVVRAWHLDSGKCSRAFENPGGDVWSVCVLPDGRRVVTGGDDKTVQLWDLAKGECLRVMKGHDDLVICVSVTPDGRRAVTGSWDTTVRVWDLESGACLHVLRGHSGRLYSVSLTPDGRRAVSGSADSTVRVWDVERGTCLHILEGHLEAVTSVSVTTDGRRVLTGSDDRTVRVWDVEQGKLLGAFLATASVRTIASYQDTCAIGLRTGEVLFVET